MTGGSLGAAEAVSASGVLAMSMPANLMAALPIASICAISARMSALFIFGMGYSARVIAARLRARGWSVHGTGSGWDIAFDDAPAVRAALSGASHVLSSVPPADGVDPVLEQYGDMLVHEWLGYLSSTGVYGDTGGAWVDETAPIGGGRRSARSLADAAWPAPGPRGFPPPPHH